MSKFKINDKVIPAGRYTWADGVKYKVIKRIEENSMCKCIFLEGDNIVWFEGDLELYKEEVQKDELTFKEVIANIKEGEVWESKFKTIKMDSEGIRINSKENGKATLFMYFDNEVKFSLKKKEYTFQEALDICNNDNTKGMKSLNSGTIYKIEGDSFYCHSSTFEGITPYIVLEEILDKWNII